MSCFEIEALVEHTAQPRAERRCGQVGEGKLISLAPPLHASPSPQGYLAHSKTPPPRTLQHDYV